MQGLIADLLNYVLRVARSRVLDQSRVKKATMTAYNSSAVQTTTMIEDGAGAIMDRSKAKRRCCSYLSSLGTTTDRHEQHLGIAFDTCITVQIKHHFRSNSFVQAVTLSTRAPPSVFKQKLSSPFSYQVDAALAKLAAMEIPYFCLAIMLHCSVSCQQLAFLSARYIPNLSMTHTKLLPLLSPQSIFLCISLLHLHPL